MLTRVLAVEATCHWCGFVPQPGEVHGLISDGGPDHILVSCAVQVHVQHPRESFRLKAEADTDDHEVARMEDEGGPPC